jgi:hypothetical protein
MRHFQQIGALARGALARGPTNFVYAFLHFDLFWLCHFPSATLVSKEKEISVQGNAYPHVDSSWRELTQPLK